MKWFGTKEDKYEVSLQCNNCQDSTLHEIEMGIMVAIYVTDKVCENCGCKGTLEVER